MSNIPTLRTALTAGLAPVAQYKQFVLYLLRERVNNPNKLDKIPLNPKTLYEGSAFHPDNWMTWQDACDLAERLGDPYGVGFAFTDNDPFFFVDIDSCLAPTRDKWSEIAMQLLDAFKGCYVEVSQSGTGLHIIGSYTAMPPHSCTNKAFGLEFYHTARFVALTGDRAINSAAYVPNDAIGASINQYFFAAQEEPASNQEWTDFHVPPTEDESLIVRMLASKPSMRAAFGGKATFSQLWNADERALARSWPDQFQGRPYDCSSADAALCQHLAFWTRKDCERMRRLLWQSKLVREKWQREDYLPRTILKACAKQDEVLQLPPTVPPKKADTLEIIAHEGPSFLTPEDQRTWFQDCVYISALNRVLTPDGILMDQQRFDVMFGGKSFGIDAANTKVAKGAWDAFCKNQMLNFPKAHDICFRPEIAPGVVIHENGGKLVNMYYPIETPSVEGDITPFLNHMGKLFPDPVDRAIIDNYLAALVQYPGDKFQFWLLIQGVQGNGKTLLLSVMEEAIGQKFCHRPKASELTGGGLRFNAWIRGRVLIGIEEIKINEGRYDLLEMMKDVITNNRLEIQGKGQDQVTGDNRANGLLFTNHRDAVPKQRGDRRYAPFFTPQQTEEDLKRDGMDGDYFPNIYNWLRNGGYTHVTYYLKNFHIDQALSPAVHHGGKLHRAPTTSSTQRALEISRSRIEQAIIESIENNESGFSGGWVSGTMVLKMLNDMPGRPSISGHRLRELLESMGYVTHPSLLNSRTNNAVMPDNKKTTLFLVKGHLALNADNAIQIAKMYSTAQPGGFGIAAPMLAAG